MPLTTGDSLGPYRILDRIGQGGMGVVYKAIDTRLDRFVALKVLPEEGGEDRDKKRRFLLEAKAASALNHPGIVDIYDIGSQGGVDFIAMEYLAGTTLAALVGEHGLPQEQVLDYGTQMAAAAGAAHAAGIVHRDLKPANVMVMPNGAVKVVDFGLAKLVEMRGPTDGVSTRSHGADTKLGTVLGTGFYMSPEQAEGRPVDARSDVFSLGVVLYELSSGRRPFSGDSFLALLSAILRQDPPPLENVPAALKAIISRCLEKDPQRRYANANELHLELLALRTRLATQRISLGALLRRRAVAAPLLGLLAVAVAVAVWFWIRDARIREARDQTLPQIRSLMNSGRFLEAFRLAREVEPYLPGDPVLKDLWANSRVVKSIRSQPPGATVSMADYAAAGDRDAWETLGSTPLENVRVPLKLVRWRLEKDGFESQEGLLDDAGERFDWPLVRPGAAEAGMVLIATNRIRLHSAAPVDLKVFWIDRFEVTNRQFKEFVDRGGYSKREYWSQPFQKAGKTLSWEQAMEEFRDATGRPGPSAWEFGTYRQAQEDFPVQGISWYEASAYAEFSGKSLPTAYHWYQAIGYPFALAESLKLANYESRGAVGVGTTQSMDLNGTFDMAGNVKEWCVNRTGDKRYILGGSWVESSYMVGQLDARDPFDRSASNGFRCIRFEGTLSASAAGPFQNPLRDYSLETPADDGTFRFYKSLYEYDRTPLNAVVGAVDDGASGWRRETITFDAAYGSERVTAYLFLPRNASPPYQTVLYQTHAGSLRRTSYDPFAKLILLGMSGDILRSGRALMYVIYKGTYERQIPTTPMGPDPMQDHGPNVWRDIVISWSKDLGRAIDYLETRPDIDRERLAYFGLSLGGALGPILTAVETRFKVSVFALGGFFMYRWPPEVEAINFAPRARTPVLMLNGRHDLIFPLQQSQLPMFRLLGAPDRDKRIVHGDGGHELPDGSNREMVEWLDKYLGRPTPARRPEAGR